MTNDPFETLEKLTDSDVDGAALAEFVDEIAAERAREQIEERLSEESISATRRSFLGGAAAGVAGGAFVGNASAQESPPSDNNPVEGEFEKVHGIATGKTYSATTAGVKAALEDEPDQNGGVYIPSGTYDVEEPIRVEDKDAFGIYANTGATFRPLSDVNVWEFVTSRRLYVEPFRVADQYEVQETADGDPPKSASAGIEIDTCRFSNFQGFVLDNTANGLVFNSKAAGSNSSRYGHVITNNIRDTGLLWTGKSVHDNTFVNVHLRMAPNSRAGWLAKANNVAGGNYVKSIRVFGGPADGIHYNQSRGFYAGTAIVDLGGDGGGKNANVRVGKEFRFHMYVDRMWLAGGSNARKNTPEDPSHGLYFEEGGSRNDFININSVFATRADGAGITLNNINRWWIGHAIAQLNTGTGISLAANVDNGGFSRIYTAGNGEVGLDAPGVIGNVHALSRQSVNESIDSSWPANVKEVLAEGP